MRSETPFEGDLGDDIGYVRIWSPSEVDESYERYEMAESLSSEWFPVGTNMGGEMIAINVGAQDSALYLLPFLGMSDEIPILRCQSYEELIAAVRAHAR